MFVFKVIEDITGTTVYVIGIIAVIPAIGLLAWFIRLAVRRKVLRFCIPWLSVVVSKIIVDQF